MTEVVGIALVTAVAALTLRELGSRAAGVFLVFSAVVILGHAATLASETLSLAVDILPKSASEIGKSILKIVGISYISAIAENTCRELAAPSVAVSVSVFARAEMLALTFPYFAEMLDVCRELLL